MNILKKITLILSIACIAASAFGMDLVDSPGMDDMDPYINWKLLTAVKSDSAEEVRSLLERGANIEYRDLPSLGTPLHIAAENGCTKTVKVLVTKGANLDAIDVPDRQTALHKAVVNNHRDAARELLLAGAKIEAREILNRTPLQVAVLKGNGEVVQLLLTFGADKEVGDVDRKTPLHIAVQHNHRGVIKVLLDAGADREAKDRSNSIPLCSALNWQEIKKGDLEKINMLLYHPQCSLQSNKQASRKRIMAALCFFNRNLFPADIKLKLLSYMPEDVLNQEHARLLLNGGANIKKLVAHCPLEWVVTIYHNTDQHYKEEFLKEIVAVVVEDRLCSVSRMVADEVVVRLVPHRGVEALLDPNNVEQHRAAIERNVRAAFGGQATEVSKDINNNNNE